MRGLLFWGLTALLTLAALSAASAMMTVRWLYPSQAPPASAGATGTAPVPPLNHTPAPPPTAQERAATDLISRSARPPATPVRAARLPGPAGAPLQVLVWADYRREGTQARGAFTVTLGDEPSYTGPMAPSGGYARLPFEPLDELARPVDLTRYQGRGLVLVAPRAPESNLPEFMSRLQSAFWTQGVDVVLVIDVRAPDWAATARMAGFSGPVWRVKARLEDVPAVTQGRLLGAAGLLVDRDGLVVASLAALDPGRYGLQDEPVEAVAAAVLRAYNLLP